MADLQKYKPLLSDNPLCGIDTYKDTLNLATGVCTRQIKKYTFTGEETVASVTATTDSEAYCCTFKFSDIDWADIKDYDKLISTYGIPIFVSSHFAPKRSTRAQYNDISAGEMGCNTTSAYNRYIVFCVSGLTTAADYSAWFAQQYANGTPIEVYYILETATTETVTVPSGLSGTEEGYLIQDGTPTPTNPIYPTANEVLIWQHSLRKLTTATESVENPLYSDGTAITAYTIKGNTVQNGTPAPSNPVDVNGVGVRTAQLLDFNTWANNVYVVRGTKVVSGNSIAITSTAATCFTGWNTTEYPAAARIPVTEGETIHLTWDTDADDSSSVWIFPNASATGEVHTAASNKSLDYTVPSGVDYITFRLDVATANKTITYSNVMFNRGSTAKPFEPYGYKIPISSPIVTTNIDLGSTQTTRQIKKLVLTSRSDADNIFAYNGTIFVQKSGMLAETNTPFCNCLVGTNLLPADAPANSVRQGRVSNQPYPAALMFKIDGVTATNEFLNFLSEMNSAGTPVIVWYVLDTPETAAVNEPLMKIGDYADTLSNAASIPTTEGANSITVDVTVQPSEFTATWTGWHNANVKEWDGSDWQ